MFTVLFSDDEKSKDDIIENCFSGNNIVNTKNYTLIKDNYERALFHIKNGIFYDFFKYRKQLRNFTKFKILCTLQDEIRESEIETGNKVIVILDSSIERGNRKIELEECTVKDAKKFLYDKIGISVSKQEICKNDEVLSNTRILKNETVIVRQKRRTNKK